MAQNLKGVKDIEIRENLGNLKDVLFSKFEWLDF